MNSQRKPLLEFVQIEHNSERYRDVVALRRRVLRTPLGLDYTAGQLEQERADVHIAAYLKGELVACVALAATDKSHRSSLKLRQMTVDPGHQGRGVGTRLIAFAEKLSAEMGYREIVLHARESAVRFYESVGYVAEGDVFTEVNLPHRKMTKELATPG
jgi:predicted GNAT family N-acyltransferase